MINFEAELQKFQPSLDVEQAEEAIYNNSMTDVTDLLQQILKGETNIGTSMPTADETKEWVEE